MNRAVENLDFSCSASASLLARWPYELAVRSSRTAPGAPAAISQRRRLVGMVGVGGPGEDAAVYL